MRRLIAAVEYKQRQYWNPFADLMALTATVQTGSQYTRSHFHPMMQAPEPVAMRLDDPGAEFDRLVALGKTPTS